MKQENKRQGTKMHGIIGIYLDVTKADTVFPRIIGHVGSRQWKQNI